MLEYSVEIILIIIDLDDVISPTLHKVFHRLSKHLEFCQNTPLRVTSSIPF